MARLVSEARPHAAVEIVAPVAAAAPGAAATWMDAGRVAVVAEARAVAAEKRAEVAEARAAAAEARGPSEAEKRAVDAEARAVDAEARAVDAEARAVDAEARLTKETTRAVDAEARAVDAEARAVDAEARAVDAEARLTKETERLSTLGVVEQRELLCVRELQARVTAAEALVAEAPLASPHAAHLREILRRAETAESLATALEKRATHAEKGLQEAVARCKSQRQTIQKLTTGLEELKQMRQRPVEVRKSAWGGCFPSGSDSATPAPAALGAPAAAAAAAAAPAPAPAPAPAAPAITPTLDPSELRAKRAARRSPEFSGVVAGFEDMWGACEAIHKVWPTGAAPLRALGWDGRPQPAPGAPPLKGDAAATWREKCELKLKEHPQLMARLAATDPNLLAGKPAHELCLISQKLMIITGGVEASPGVAPSNRAGKRPR